MFRSEATKKSKKMGGKRSITIESADGDDSKALAALPWWDPANPYKMRWDLPELLSQSVRNVS